jgi:hypothetical protein
VFVSQLFIPFFFSIVKFYREINRLESQVEIILTSCTLYVYTIVFCRLTSMPRCTIHLT